MRKLHPDFEIVYTPQIHSQAYVVRNIHDRYHCTDPIRGVKKVKQIALQMQRDFEETQLLDRAVVATCGAP
jgi:hypothetical protein